MDDGTYAAIHAARWDSYGIPWNVMELHGTRGDVHLSELQHHMNVDGLGRCIIQSPSWFEIDTLMVRALR